MYNRVMLQRAGVQGIGQEIKLSLEESLIQGACRKLFSFNQMYRSVGVTTGRPQ